MSNLTLQDLDNLIKQTKKNPYNLPMETYSLKMTIKLRENGIKNWFLNYIEQRDYFPTNTLTLRFMIMAVHEFKPPLHVDRIITFHKTEKGLVDILAIEQESAFNDITMMIRCLESNNKECRLCRSLYILANRECNFSKCKVKYESKKRIFI